MSYGYLHDCKGNKSSKRLWGSIFSVLGLAMAITLFVLSIFFKMTDGNMMCRVMEFILGGGITLLVAGSAAEGLQYFRKEKKGKNSV